MVEDDDLRALFFADFGEEVVLKNEGEADRTITAIFDARPVEERSLDGAQVGFKSASQNTGNAPQLRCVTSDVEGVKAGRTKVTVRGKDYNVWDPKPDHTGLSTLILKLA